MPLGMFTFIGMCAACLLVHGADKKIMLHPESKIAVSSVVAVNSVGAQSTVMQIDLAYDLCPSASLSPHLNPPTVLYLVATSLCPSLFALYFACMVIMDLLTVRPAILIVACQFHRTLSLSFRFYLRFERDNLLLECLDVGMDGLHFQGKLDLGYGERCYGSTVRWHCCR
jgi:hypothetical protein